jgi:nicotinate-nucleotide adenylyltransferase
LIDAPTAAVSSTEVRRRVAAGESIVGLVPDAVATYIKGHHLYA